MQNNQIKRDSGKAAADGVLTGAVYPSCSMRADRVQTSTAVMRPNPEPKPAVFEVVVRLLSWEIIL